jgi:hypothetical protein
MGRQVDSSETEALYNFVTKNPGASTGKIFAFMNKKFGIKSNTLTQRMKKDPALRKASGESGSCELCWYFDAALVVQTSGTRRSTTRTSADPFGPKKQDLRDKKLSVLKEYGPKEVSLIVTLPGETLRNPGNHESQVLDLHPGARGYGAEEKSEIYDQIYLCSNKPARYQVFPGKLFHVLDHLEEPIQYGDADFMGGLKPETWQSVRMFFEKMDDGGLLCITLNEFFRSTGGYKGAFGHHKRNNELNLLTELENIAHQVERQVRMVLYETYVSNKTPMVTIGFVVTGEPTFYDYE